jgi:hypothetical protein
MTMAIFNIVIDYEIDRSKAQNPLTPEQVEAEIRRAFESLKEVGSFMTDGSPIVAKSVKVELTTWD